MKFQPRAANCKQLAPTAGLSFGREYRGQRDFPSDLIFMKQKAFPESHLVSCLWRPTSESSSHSYFTQHTRGLQTLFKAGLIQLPLPAHGGKCLKDTDFVTSGYSDSGPLGGRT